MKTALASRLPDRGTEPDALIREARKRRRRRYLMAGLCSVAVLAGTVAVIAGTGAAGRPRPPGRHAGPTAPAAAGRPRAATPPGPILAGSDTTVVTWPVGYPAFGPGFAPPAYLDDLSTGRLSRRQVPGIAGCDCNPYMISIGRWLVYVGSGGTDAIRSDLKGTPRVLGATGFFAPSAAPGHVWLVRFHGYQGHVPARVQSVPVAGGRPGPVITLPADAVNLVEGTSAGLLVEVQRRLAHNYLFFGLALWNPGALPVALPYSPSWGDGFAADARLIAYGTGCRSEVTAANTGYDACRTLRLLNVVTGRLVSFPAPPGTAGWVPAGFNRVSAISPGDQMISAYAAASPSRTRRFRLYLVRLAGPYVGATTVPSAAPLIAGTAWSVHGSWLLFQGPRGHLSAYQLTNGKTRTSNAPCCQSEVMVTGPSYSG
jgi:hypothetical protein